MPKRHTALFFARLAFPTTELTQPKGGCNEPTGCPPCFMEVTHEKRLITMLLALLMVMGLLPTAAFAASTPEEALGEIDIYSGGEELSYLSINGRVRTLIYTYYNYDNGSGVTREIPAYCVNPNITGVPQTVAPGESIEYLAEEKSSDPKVIGIVASGYPTRSLEELGLEGTSTRVIMPQKWRSGVTS